MPGDLSPYPATISAKRQIEAIASSTELIELLQLSQKLSAATARSAEPHLLLEALRDLAEVDVFSTLVAIESLASLHHTGADTELAGLLDHPVELVRRHATWRLMGRPPMAETYRRLVNRLMVGGIETMHAHRTLRAWAASDARGIAGAISEALDHVSDPAARTRLIDTLGVVEYPSVNHALARIALDPSEAPSSRAAAVGALGHRPGAGFEPALRILSQADDELGIHAAIAIADLSAGPAESQDQLGRDSRYEVLSRRPMTPTGNGLRVAQLTLAGELDRELSRGGMGDTGGVASLLVSLGRSLARRKDVDHVLTIGRGSVTDVIADQLVPDEGSLAYGTLAYGDDERTADSPQQAWEHLPVIERGLTRVLRNWPTVDILHLRMADVGALAGTQVAAELGIETCFSLAPDPHSVIQSLQSQGRLDRRSFIDMASTDHLWFRARLVEQLAATTPRLALFPRSKPHTFFDAVSDDKPAENRSAVVPEGIDLTLTERAEWSLSSDGSSQVLDELAAMVPPDRRHLPLLVSVGRLNPIKGMDRVAAAWASDPRLYESCTLVIVGGSLCDPTPVEQSVLGAIERAVDESSTGAGRATAGSLRAGLILFGGRPRDDIALILAATRAGYAGGWAPGGTYVDGAHKEEFGLALIEALAAGLVVTAPNVGGPPTYVEQGQTGILVDPQADLAPAIHQAFALVAEPGRAARARRMVEERYSVDTMAELLVDLYSTEPALL